MSLCNNILYNKIAMTNNNMSSCNNILYNIIAMTNNNMSLDLFTANS